MALAGYTRTITSILRGCFTIFGCLHTAKMVVCYRMRSRTVTSMLSVRDHGSVFGCFYAIEMMRSYEMR